MLNVMCGRVVRCMDNTSDYNKLTRAFWHMNKLSLFSLDFCSNFAPLFLHFFLEKKKKRKMIVYRFTNVCSKRKRTFCERCTIVTVMRLYLCGECQCVCICARVYFYVVCGPIFICRFDAQTNAHTHICRIGVNHLYVSVCTERPTTFLRRVHFSL